MIGKLDQALRFHQTALSLRAERQQVPWHRVVVRLHFRGGFLQPTFFNDLWAVLVDVACVGWADREGEIALRTDHIFRIFSNTKLVTSCAVLLLLVAGVGIAGFVLGAKLLVEAPVSQLSGLNGLFVALAALAASSAPRLAGIAHEVRNPLTGVSLLLDDLHDRAGSRAPRWPLYRVPRWWAGSSRAGCGRAPATGRGSAGSGGRWDGSRAST